MRFYYENYMGDKGYFSERNLVKAIYTAWNIEADLYLLKGEAEKLKKYRSTISQMAILRENSELIFSPHDGNEFNSQILEPFGYKLEDVGEYREIVEIKTGKIIKYDWSEVKKLN